MSENLEHQSKDNVLEKEARLFTHYLLDCEPHPEMVDRYINASRKLSSDVVDSLDAGIMKFVLNHPWSVPFLDAVSGFLQPDVLLRKKIYIMAAVLEASPRYTQHFLPQNLSRFSFFLNLIANGLFASTKIIIGIPIFFFLRKYHND